MVFSLRLNLQCATDWQHSIDLFSTRAKVQINMQSKCTKTYKVLKKRFEIMDLTYVELYFRLIFDCVLFVQPVTFFYWEGDAG